MNMPPDPYGYPDGMSQPPLVQGNGRADIGAAVKYGFNTTFKELGTWLLFSVLYFMFTLGVTAIFSLVINFAVMSMDVGTEAVSAEIVSFLSNLVSGLCSVIGSVFLINAALQRVGGVMPTLESAFKNANIKTAILAGFMVSLMTFVIVLPSTISKINSSSEVPNLADPAAVAAIDLTWLWFLGAELIVLVLLAPLLLYPIYYALDGNSSAVDSIRQAVKLGMKHYPALLLLMIVMTLIVVAGLLVCCIGMVFSIPINVLVSTHVFRQITGGKHEQVV